MGNFRSHSKTSPMIYLMWFLPTIFYVIKLAVDSSAGLMASDWMQSFSITASQVGTILFARAIGYSLMQIPIGLLLDKFGPRYIAFIFLSMCSLGILISATSNNWSVLLLGSCLYGVGAAAGFASANKILVIWFPPKNYALMTGITVAFILFGAVIGKDVVVLLKPEIWQNIESLNQFKPWQNILIVFGVIEVTIAILALIVIRNGRNNIQGPKSENVLGNLTNVLLNRRVIIIAVLGGLLVGSLNGFCFAWGDKFFIVFYNITLEQASILTKEIAVGMMVASPFMGYFADKFNLHKTLTVCSAIAMALCLGVCLYWQMPIFIVKVCMFIVGVGCSYQVLVFTMGVKEIGPAQSATAIGVIQTVNMLFAAFYPKFIGYLLDYSWESHGSLEGSMRNYSVNDYQFALSSIMVAATISVLGMTLLHTKSK